MTNIIRGIRNILGERNSSLLSIQIYPNNEMIFNVYQTEIPIVVNIKENRVYVDCWFTDIKMSSDILEELVGICRILENNIGNIEGVLFGKED